LNNHSFDVLLKIVMCPWITCEKLEITSW